MKMAISKEQQDRLERLAAASEDDIDTSDIPEVLDWSGAVRGRHPNAREETVTLRLDADVLAWFRDHAKGSRGYQMEINRALRQYVAAHGHPGA